MLDAGRAVYICEGRGMGPNAWTGVVCCCEVDDIESGATSCSERLRSKDQLAFETQASDRLSRIDGLGAHDGVATLVHAPSPALEILLAAMKTATPLYRSTEEAFGGSPSPQAAPVSMGSSPKRQGCKPYDAAKANGGATTRLTIWRVSKPEAIEALQALYAPMSSQVTDERSHLLAEAAERLCLRERRERSVVTGREPFNVFPALLVAADAARPESPAVPDGLFVHPLS